jgi:hypothetical protein
MQASMSRGQPSRAERLPLAFAGVDAEWLTERLQPRYPGAEIRAMGLIAEIRGHTSKARYELDRNAAAIEAGIPAQVCVKANLTGDPLSSMVCVNEARFYGLLRGRLDLPAPHCLIADWDDDAQGMQGFVLMEDLVPLGGQFGGSGQLVSLDEMASSLEQLARLHGNTWNVPELNEHGWLQTAMAPDTFTDDYWSLMRDYVPRHNARTEHLERLPQWAAQDPNRLHQAFRALCAREMAQSGPLCLVHGDAHLGNSYRPRDGKRIWFDWQIVRKGRPWRDVTYFVVGSLTVEQRRRAERELVSHYCEELARYGVALDVDTAWTDYRRWILWGVIAWHLNINPNEDTLLLLDRFGRAAHDHDLGAFYGF